MPWVIVGLGNPGPQYEATRHNVGWLALDRVGEALGAGAFREESRFQAALASGRLKGEALHLVKPLTYMNLSGEAVQRVAAYYKATPAQVLVLYDDFAIPFGHLRLRADGRDGGHNGIKSLTKCLGTASYPRLRLGIGPVPPKWDPADFVLGAWTAPEMDFLPKFLARAQEACEVVLLQGLEKAGARYNGPHPELALVQPGPKST